MRAFRKILSVLLLLIIVPVVTGQIALHSVRSLLTDPAFPKGVVREAGVHTQVEDAILRSVLARANQAGIPLSRQRLTRVVDQVLPLARRERISDELIDGLYAWAWGSNPVPTIVIDLTDIRRNLKPAVQAELEAEIEALPTCTREQLQKLLASSSAGMPPCKAADKRINAAFVDHIIQNLKLDLVPERLDLAAVMAAGEGAGFWDEIWYEIQWVRALLNLIIWGWVVVTVLLLLLALLNLDHWHTPFGWAGAALTLGSGPLFLAAMGGLEVVLPLFEQAVPADGVGTAVVAAALGGISLVLRNVSFFVLLLGLGAILVAVAGAMTSRPAEETAPPPPSA